MVGTRQTAGPADLSGKEYRCSHPDFSTHPSTTGCFSNRDLELDPCYSGEVAENGEYSEIFANLFSLDGWILLPGCVLIASGKRQIQPDFSAAEGGYPATGDELSEQTA